MTSPVPPPSKGAPSAGRGFALVAIVVALLAVVLALASSMIAWRASTKAGDAARRIEALEKSRVAEPAPEATTPPADQPVAADPTIDPAGPDPGTSSAPVLNAQTQYKVRYTDKALTIGPSCSTAVYLDLDEPRVQVPSGIAEFRYLDACGTDPASFRMQEGIDGTKVSSDQVTPVECADQIGSSPLLHDHNIPVHRGDVFCLTTSLDTARANGITWKMVLLSVQATAQDGTVSLKASAWDIPG